MFGFQHLPNYDNIQILQRFSFITKLNLFYLIFSYQSLIAKETLSLFSETYPIIDKQNKTVNKIKKHLE